MFCKNCGNNMPENATFCAACGTPAAAEAAPAAAAAPAIAGKISSNNLVKLIAIIAAAVLLIVAFASILGGSNPKALAKKYVKASLSGDIKAQYGMMAGKVQKYLEKEVLDDDDITDELFENMEEDCDDLDVKVKVNNFNQYYKANEKLTKAEMKETFGKNYKIKVEVREVKDLRNSEIDDIKDYIEDDDDMEDYINADKIKKGKKVTVKVIIDGKEDTETYDTEIWVVKYKGQWKVVDYQFFATIAQYLAWL